MVIRLSGGNADLPVADSSYTVVRFLSNKSIPLIIVLAKHNVKSPSNVKAFNARGLLHMIHLGFCIPITQGSWTAIMESIELRRGVGTPGTFPLNALYRENNVRCRRC